MINTWNETFLHEELKEYFCGKTGQTEVPVEGSICDVVLPDGEIVEIQTSNLAKLKLKLKKLLASRTVNIVYPVAVNTIIETLNPDNTLVSRRKSPKHGTIFQLFKELTGIYPLLRQPNFRITVVFTDVTEIRIADGTGSWRRKGVHIENRKLDKMHHTLVFNSPVDYCSLIPESLSEPFTVKDLAAAGAGKYAGRMAWVLTKAELIERAGKEGKAYLYKRI